MADYSCGIKAGTSNFLKEGIEIKNFYGLLYLSPIILGSKICPALGGSRSYSWKCILELDRFPSRDRELDARQKESIL